MDTQRWPGGSAGEGGRRRRPRWASALVGAVIGWSLGPIALGASGPSPGEPGPSGSPRAEASRVAPAPRAAPRAEASRVVLPSDDWTFRPTVMVRRGHSQGSGTIIASIDGETLVLTAAHVVGEPGPIAIDLYRYNLGLERAPMSGDWPRPVVADLAAIDRAADLAVLRVEGLGALPYVARLAAARDEPAVESIVTSIGIDLGRHLSSWSTRLVEALWFELNDNREERLFFITARAPEHGRSGGGLFLPSGELVGVCIGHAELIRGRRQGVFASRESIRKLLDDHDDLTPVIARSERLRERLARRPSRRPVAGGRAAAPSAPAPVTPTGANGGGR